MGRWSVVAFGGAGATRTDRQSFVATQNVGSGGLGFRYKLASKFGMDAGIDVAHSPGTTAVYLGGGQCVVPALMRDMPAFGSPRSLVEARTKVMSLDRCDLPVSKDRAHEVHEKDKIEQPS